ncbi:adenylate/guanylate cyclase domain-containing protein [Rhodoferax sp.]|uniref:CHASE2 domain-containing protein n=1 Tax=Rhodoferax sp. TaxID=50421 RepID=UPI0025F8E197|nr:adenylate/guanylate cyclase domain-containing protein [Rhodoferax sp.]
MVGAFQSEGTEFLGRRPVFMRQPRFLHSFRAPVPTACEKERSKHNQCDVSGTSLPEAESNPQMKFIALILAKAKRWLNPPTLIAGFWLAVAVLLSLTPAIQLVELKILDRLLVATAPNKSSYPITIVGIDADSFVKLGLQWPWPRSLHADLLDRLSTDGASVVAFDVLFAEPSGRGPEDDQRFVQAIKRSGNVVLAADRVYRETSTTSEWQRLDPLPLFLQAGAQIGLATVPLDQDLVVRQVPDSSEAMWRTTVLRLIREHPELAPNLSSEQGSYIRYVGGDHTFPYVSYHEIVQPDGTLPPGYFKDQVVLVGLAARASLNAQSAQADLFHTPFLAHTGGLMPGVEVHANLIETALARNAIARLPNAALLLLLSMVAAASVLTMHNWRPVRGALAGGGLMLLIVGVAWASLQRFNLWVPTVMALAVVVLIYLSLGGRSYLIELARRAEITRAFSLYVTPQVVAYMIAHPEQMKLGGERRNITLMFTDLAGFTSISEAHSAERVASLLNRHFTEMTDIVLEHHGTVVTFIGDAIMAMWGAPLEDDAQAYRAVSSAMVMQKRMHTMRESFAKEGLPPIHMRVGIHSGSAVVGNLGSAKRFDYTAIGDDVNLAARLEGTNKIYGTEILVSFDTLKQVGERIRFRVVDRVIVKGKSQAIEVFTPCEDERVIDLTARGVELFRSQRWDEAQALMQELSALVPDDKIAGIYLQRIQEFRLDPPGENWSGAISLEKN